MSQSVLLITGNAGVGKTMVARAWAQARGGAAITGDDIYLWMRSQNFRRRDFHQEQLVAAIAIDAARHFSSLGLDVVIEYVWRPSTIDKIQKQLSALAEVRAVRLTCGIDENHRRNTARPAGVLPSEQVNLLARELDQMVWPSEIMTIDSTNQSI